METTSTYQSGLQSEGRRAARVEVDGVVVVGGDNEKGGTNQLWYISAYIIHHTW